MFLNGFLFLPKMAGLRVQREQLQIHGTRQRQGHLYQQHKLLYSMRTVAQDFQALRHMIN
jgi:hypothetical protein